MIAPTTIGSSQFKSRRDPLAYFQKSIKRDKSHYTVLKDEGHWHEWQQTIKSTAHSHACENIFDVNYVPSTTDNTALFCEQQTFLYDVFNTILKLFCKATRMVSNQEKSTLTIIGCSQVEINYALQRFPYTILPFEGVLKYLGFRLKPSSYRIAYWTCQVAKV